MTCNYRDIVMRPTKGSSAATDSCSQFFQAMRGYILVVFGSLRETKNVSLLRFLR